MTPFSPKAPNCPPGPLSAYKTSFKNKTTLCPPSCNSLIFWSLHCRISGVTYTLAASSTHSLSPGYHYSYIIPFTTISQFLDILYFVRFHFGAFLFTYLQADSFLSCVQSTDEPVKGTHTCSIHLFLFLAFLFDSRGLHLLLTQLFSYVDAFSVRDHSIISQLF